MQFSFCRSKIRFHHFQQTITVSYALSSYYQSQKSIVNLKNCQNNFLQLPNPKWQFIFGFQTNNATLHCEVRTFMRHFLIIIYNCLRSNLNLDKVSRKKPHMVICKKILFLPYLQSTICASSLSISLSFFRAATSQRGYKEKTG